MSHVTPLTAEDRADWDGLWRGYLEFYGSEVPEAVTDATFDRLLDPGVDMHGALARDPDGAAIGLVHWLTHPATWSLGPYCYLEDLFVSPHARGGGHGRALIEHVARWARAEGCHKVYWLTQRSNATARALYDRVARDAGFMQYAIPLA